MDIYGLLYKYHEKKSETGKVRDSSETYLATIYS